MFNFDYVCIIYALLNLINHAPHIDKTYLYAKDLYEAQ